MNWLLRKIPLKFVVIGIVIVAVIITTAIVFRPSTPSSQSSGGAGRGQRQIPVETQIVKVSDVGGGLTFTGSISPLFTTNVSSKINGKVIELMVKTGDRVKVGQPLAKIDTTTLEQQISQSEASTALNEAQYKRSVNDQHNAVAKAEKDYAMQQAQYEKTLSDQQNAVALAKQAVAISQAQLNNAIISQQNSIAAAEQAVATAQTSLNKAINDTQQALTNAQNTLSFQRDNLQTSQLNNSQTLDLNVLQALNSYQSALDSGKKSDQDAALYRLLSAQASMSQAQQSPISNLSNVIKSYMDAQASLQAAQNSQTVQLAQEQLNEKLIALANAQAASTDLPQQQFNRDQMALSNAESAMKNTINVANAQLEQSQQSLISAKSLDAVNVSAAQYQQSATNLKVLKEQLQDGVLLSPVDGIITSINTPIGQNTGGQSSVVSIAAVDPIQAIVNVSEANIGKIKLDMEMIVRIPTLDKTFNGKVSAIRPTLDSVTKSYGVEIVIDDAKHELLPGMFAMSSLKSAGRQAIMVPADAVLSQPSGNAVFVVQDGRAKKVLVKTGTLTSAQFEIVEGLKEGEELVVKGQELLSDKAQVQVLKPGQNSSDGKNQGQGGQKSGGGSQGQGKRSQQGGEQSNPQESGGAPNRVPGAGGQ